ncbi:hypothetical protein ACFLS1_01850 [Verrucomicrobiota bacterium]
MKLVHAIAALLAVAMLSVSLVGCSKKDEVVAPEKKATVEHPADAKPKDHPAH